MRVLYVIDSLRLGGAERSLAVLAPHLIERGIRLDVAYFHDREGVQRSLTEAGATLHLVASTNRLTRTRLVTKLVRDLRPDIVHTTLFEADVTGRISGLVGGVPVISSVVNMAYGRAQYRQTTIRSTRLAAAHVVDATTSRIAARLHAVSEAVADQMGARLRYPRHRIDVIPGGRDPAQLGERSEARRDAARRSLRLGPNDELIVAIGRLEHQKGFDVLLEALELLAISRPRLRTVVVGESGAMEHALRAQAASMKANVEFLGGRTDVPELLCAADALAFPSRWEGMPGVLIEALALETPIVASRIKPVLEVTGPHVGRLVAPEEHRALATALELVLDDPASSGVREGRQRFLDRFTVGRCAELHVEQYQRVLAR